MPQDLKKYMMKKMTNGFRNFVLLRSPAMQIIAVHRVLQKSKKCNISKIILFASKFEKNEGRHLIT